MAKTKKKIKFLYIAGSTLDHYAMFVNIKKQVNIVAMQVCLHKIGARLLGKFTICIDNAGLLRGPALYQYKNVS